MITGGCGDISGTNGSSERLPEEDRGTALGASDVFGPGDPGNGQIAWSPDGATIYHPAAGQIMAVEVSTGDRHSIGARSFWLRPTADGVWIFASRFVRNGASGEYVVSRYPTSTGAAREDVLRVSDDDFIISEGGERVFYPSHNEPAELRVYTLATGTTEAVAVESPAPLHPLSPDGGHVATWGTSEVWRIDLAEGSVAPVWSGDQNSPRLEALRWTDDGRIRLLLYRYAVVYLFEEGVGTRSVASLPGPTTNVGWVGWSANGERAAAWKDRQAYPSGYSVFDLFLIDIDSGRIRAIGTANLPTGLYPSRPLFSPDGARLAYVLNGGLYLKELPAP